MDTGILPHMDDEESLYFKPNELLLYQHAQDHSWTVEELTAVVALLKLPEFKPAD
jgi:hypothetical protein